MVDKKEIQKNLEYARGYRDALVDTWEEVLKMATKGYSSHEVQIVAKTQSNDAKRKIELKIAELEADLAQDDIIDIEEISPAPATTQPEPSAELKMSPRMSYLVREAKPVKCYDMLQREIGKDRPALIIARTPAIEIREKYNIGKSMVIWLTMNEKGIDNLPVSALGVANDMHANNSNDEYVKPGELPKLYSLALNFLDSYNEGVILFEGVEYLATHNKFQSLMNFLQMLNEYVSQKGFNLIISMNPAAFEAKQLSLIESEIGNIV